MWFYMYFWTFAGFQGQFGGIASHRAFILGGSWAVMRGASSRIARLMTHITRTPNGLLMEPLWSLIVGFQGILEGSWGV